MTIPSDPKRCNSRGPARSLQASEHPIPIPPRNRPSANSHPTSSRLPFRSYLCCDSIIPSASLGHRPRFLQNIASCAWRTAPRSSLPFLSKTSLAPFRPRQFFHQRYTNLLTLPFVSPAPLHKPLLQTRIDNPSRFLRRCCRQSFLSAFDSLSSRALALTEDCPGREGKPPAQRLGLKQFIPSRRPGSHSYKMSNYPRRSARISHLQGQDRNNLSAPSFTHGFSQSSSTSTSSHPSPVSDGLQAAEPQPAQLSQPQHQMQSLFMPLQPQQQQQAHAHAPLPSPSTAELEPFFGRSHSQPNPYSSQQSHLSFQAQQRQQSYQGPSQQTEQPQMHHQLHPHTNSMSQEHPIHGQALNPGQLPPDFLAEAAKRAQIACLMRDLGDVSL